MNREKATHTQTHTHTEVLLVYVFMTLLDLVTCVMYFCAVCQLPKCVFWLQSGSCIVRNVDEKWQAIITRHGCPHLSFGLDTTDSGENWEKKKKC